MTFSLPRRCNVVAGRQFAKRLSELSDRELWVLATLKLGGSVFGGGRSGNVGLNFTNQVSPRKWVTSYTTVKWADTLAQLVKAGWLRFATVEENGEFGNYWLTYAAEDVMKWV